MKYAVTTSAGLARNFAGRVWSSEGTYLIGRVERTDVWLLCSVAQRGYSGTLYLKRENLDKQTLFRQIPTVECQGYFCGRNA
jgi:hypothetical protein